MCGLAGFLDNKSSKDDKIKALNLMEKPLIPRGPDDIGIYIDDNIALIHRRLAIVDIKHGRQPLFSENKNIILVCNGEIYNAEILRKKLIDKGHKFSTKSDNEVIIHLYEELDIEFLQKLRGMFAFALWDKNKNILILARDRTGEKPLYYYKNNNFFAFSSLITSLINHPKIQAKLDMWSINKYLTYDFIPSPNTPFLGIKKLRPGYTLIINTSTNETKELCYWDIDNFHVGFSRLSDKSLKFKVLEELFKKAISEQLMSDVPITLLLSGGLDSSLIAYFLTKKLNKNITAFTVSFEEKSYNESNYAEYIAQFLGIKLNKILFPTKAQELSKVVSLSLECLDEPIADPSVVPTYHLLNSVSRKFKVALGGDGGDELFIGYIVFMANRLVNFYNFLPYSLRKNINTVLKKIAPISPKYMSFNFKFNQFIKGSGLSPEARFFTWIGSFSEEEKFDLWKNSIIYNSYIHKNTFEDIFYYLNKININNEMERLIYLCFKLYLGDDILVKTDRLSMNNSLEVRSPFLDYRIIEFAFQLPYFEKFRYLKLKYFLKNFAKKYLPKKIINRPKKGFTFPVASLINTDLKELVDDILLDKNNPLMNIFRRTAIENLINEHHKGLKDNRKKIWSLFTLFYWVNFITNNYKTIQMQ